MPGRKEIMKLNVSKSKMYRLVSDTLENLPKMKDTDFKTYKGTSWLQYRETGLDHLMKVCLDCYAGSVHMMVEDMSEKINYIVHLDIEDIKNRGMLD